MGDDIQRLFREVADLSPVEREQYFDHRGVTPQIREEIESLLGFDSFERPDQETLSACCGRNPVQPFQLPVKDGGCLF